MKHEITRDTILYNCDRDEKLQRELRSIENERATRQDNKSNTLLRDITHLDFPLTVFARCSLANIQIDPITMTQNTYTPPEFVYNATEFNCTETIVTVSCPSNI